MSKEPGGWETALAVKHFLKKTLLVLWRCTHFMMNITLNSRGKFNDFDGMTWYLQGFVLLAGWSHFPCSLCVSLLQAFAQSVAGETEEVCAISMVPSPLPNPNSLKQLTVHSSQHHLYVCSKRLILHLWKFCTFHRYHHRCALASYPMSFSC